VITSIIASTVNQLPEGANITFKHDMEGRSTPTWKARIDLNISREQHRPSRRMGEADDGEVVARAESIDR
jgi:hypothetical protein